MLSIRPRHCSTNQGVSTRMKPARQTSSMPWPASVACIARSKTFAVGKSLVIDHRRRNALRFARNPARRRRRHWTGPARSRPEIPAPAPPRPASACWSRARKSASRRAFLRRSQRQLSREGDALASRRRDDLAETHRVLRRRRARLPRLPAAWAASATTIMPTPQLKVRSISRSATPPARASQLNTGRTGIAPRSIWTPRPSGSTRGIFSGIAAAGDMGESLDRLRFSQARAAGASHRCGSAPAAPRPSVLPGAKGAGSAKIQPGALDDLAHQRKAVGMDARGAQAEQ